jgi:hypothetical protein
MAEVQVFHKDLKGIPFVETDPEKIRHGEVEDFVDPALERRLLRKFDITILPMLAIMYLFK